MWTEIAQSIESQIDKNGTKSLFFKYQTEHKIACSEYNYWLLSKKSAVVLQFLNKIEEQGRIEVFLEMLSERIMDIFLTSNQYLAGDKQHFNNTKNVYRQFVIDIKNLCEQKSIAKKDIEKVFSAHYDRLRRCISDNNGQGMVEEYTKSPTIVPKICAEYSASLQLDVLGLDIEKIKQPVLDIGCGSGAPLVAYLRANGVEAIGLDRNVKQTDYLIASDYLDYDFKSKKYGTVVSHMAFSNQLWYATQKCSVHAQRYFHKFIEILYSLKPGGCFVYSPGIPFMEAQLPKGFQIKKVYVFENSSRLYAAIIQREQ